MLVASRPMKRGTAGIIALAAALLAGLAFSSGAAAKTTWLCKPGLGSNPCRGSLQTTVIAPDGTSRVETAKNARHPSIDCFYVYPTVSEQPTVNANKHIDPQQVAIAQYQAARFSEVCDVYAPVYRQLTLQGISSPESLDPAAVKLAYGDVLKAWREYLHRFNDGRGVVLIGHSQGTGMLTKLLRSVIERKRAQRRRLVSALLLGGNVTVRKGSGVGGSFRRTPVCRSKTDLGCVVAFSTFGETPPADAIFGTTDGALADTHGVDPDELKVVCTNPSTLSAKAGRLQTLARGEPFPGTLGLGLQLLYGGPQPTAATPWLEPQDRYSGRCVRRNGANVLLLSPLDGAHTLNPSPTPQWGLHLVDVNIGLGNLVRLVRSQAAYYNEP